MPKSLSRTFFSFLVLALLMLSVNGCGPQHPVVDLSANGQFDPAKIDGEAVVLVAKQVPLARYKGLAIITPPDCRMIVDEVGQLKALGYFDEVVGLDDLSDFVAERHLLPGSVAFDSWADYQALEKAYKPYLLVRFRCIRRGEIWYRLTVLDPETVDILFSSEVRVWTPFGYFMRSLLTLGGGLSVDDDCVGPDEDVRLPLYNALLGWINENR